jgi:hypothetical protein
LIFHRIRWFNPEWIIDFATRGRRVTYLKWWTDTTPGQGYVTARLFAGPSFEDNSYCGTIVLPPSDWEKLLDVMIHGAAQLNFDDGRVKVFFGPDDGSEE